MGWLIYIFFVSGEMSAMYSTYFTVRLIIKHGFNCLSEQLLPTAKTETSQCSRFQKDDNLI